MQNNQKGVINAATTDATGTRVAKKRTNPTGGGKARHARRQSTADVLVGTKPVHFSHRAKDEPWTLLANRSAKERSAPVYLLENYTGPSVKTLTYLAATGLFLVGALAGAVVGKVAL